MHLTQVIGQTRAKATLSKLASSGNVPHALLFLGSEGTGGLALALAFAQMLQCTQANPATGESCGHCPSCKKAAQFIHPDIHFSFPSTGAKAVSTDFLKQWRSCLTESAYPSANSWLAQIASENKQGNITAEECGRIMRTLSLMAFEGKYKILVLWLPEYLGKEGNRLLKLIEEPPEQTIFLLVAEDSEKILLTILSRCQLIRLDPLSDDEVAGALSREGATETQARQIAFMSEGNYAEARAALRHETHDEASAFLDWLRKCYQGKPPELVQWVEDFSKRGRENQKQFVIFGLHFLREMLVLSMLGGEKIRLDAEQLQTAQRLAKVLSFEKIDELTELLNQHHYHIERNANPKTLFLDASIRIHKIMRAS